MKYKNKLRFDFAILNKSKPIILIEFDGIQHFKPKNFGGISHQKATEDFEELKIKDKIKTDYCNKNKIKLIRIHYTQIHYTQINDIEYILNKEIPRKFYTLKGMELRRA